MKFRILLFLLVTGLQAFSQKKQPNIILILADDIGFEAFGSYGNTNYKTPRIDKMAAIDMGLSKKQPYYFIVNNMKAIIIILVSIFAFGLKLKETPIQKPNVLMISIDDLNDWVGVMGGNSSAITPNIDKLASEGVLFMNAHCQTALCGPSRASIMSGLRPSTSGIYGQLKDEEIREASAAMEGIKFLPEYFGENGYKTMGVGKIFH